MDMHDALVLGKASPGVICCALRAKLLNRGVQTADLVAPISKRGLREDDNGEQEQEDFLPAFHLFGVGRASCRDLEGFCRGAKTRRKAKAKFAGARAVITGLRSSFFPWRPFCALTGNSCYSSKSTAATCSLMLRPKSATFTCSGWTV